MIRHAKFLRILLVFGILLAAVALSGCRQEEPTPTVVAEAASVATSTDLPPTDTPTPAGTDTPPPPTATPPPSPTSPLVNTVPPAPTMTPAATGIPEMLVRVIDAASGAPVFDATVALFIETLNLSITEQTGEDGSAQFVNLGPGVYPVTVSAVTYEEAEPTEVQIGGGVNVVEIPLNRLPPPEVYAVADAGRTNLRNGPGGEFAVLRKIEFGERVQVIGRTRDQQWLLVTTNDSLQGWVAAEVMSVDTAVELVYEATPAATSTPTPLPDVLGTFVAKANVRARPNADAALVAELPEGTVVPVLAQTEDRNWYLIRLATGAEAWVFGEVIELDQPQDIVPLYVPTPIPSPTIDPSVTPPTATPPPPPTPTPLPTTVPGQIATPAPFNPFYFRDAVWAMDSYAVTMSGLLDQMKATSTTVEDCEVFSFNYKKTISAPVYADVHPDWRGMYGLYEEARAAALDNMASIYDACQNLGEISDLNYSLAREGINRAHDTLVAVKEQINERTPEGVPTPNP